MGVTLKEVAKRAGVSIGTASMALNNSNKVNVETVKKVQEIARKLNYVPNARARALVKKSTEIIALVVPHIINPFFAELAQAVKDSAREEGYNLILCSTDGEADEEIRYIEHFKNGMIDGAIFASQEQLTKANSSSLEELAKNYIPIVNINSQDFASEIVPVVKTDLKYAGYIATKHLIDLGHKKIGFASHSPRRYAGYLKALKEYKIDYSDFIYHPMQEIDDIINDIVLAKEKPSAFVCYNDKSAIKMIQLLIDRGINVPEDISVIGTDNIKIARYYNPPLTTINIPIEEMGKHAAKILISLIMGKKLCKEEMQISYPSNLLIRKSTSKYIP